MIKENINSKKSANMLRVLTLNLWQRYGEWNDRRFVLIERIKELQPDLVAFYESIKTDEYDQVLDLLGPGFNIAHSKIRDPNGMGISIASRWPFGEMKEIDLNVTPRTDGFPCTTLIAEIIGPEAILFVNHFPNWQLNFEYERELQAVKVARLVEEQVGKSIKQVVLVGDLDADHDAASIRFWTGRQSLGNMSVCYRYTWESIHPEYSGHTFSPINPLVKNEEVKGMKPFRDWPFRRIDYIFVRFGAHGGNALDILTCDRIFDEPINGIWASDHFGLIVDLAKPLV